MSAHRFLICGSDTGVGKTYISAALLTAWRAAGLRVRAVKPIESGVQAQEVQPDEDGALLCHAAQQANPSGALTRLRAPLSPPLAADIDNISLDFQAWVAAAERLADEADVLLIEGAGGLLSPLTWERDARDLALSLDAAAIAVVHNKLGAVHQTRAIGVALQAAGVELAGVVLNLSGADDLASQTNAPQIRRYLPSAALAECGAGASGARLEEQLGPILQLGMR